MIAQFMTRTVEFMREKYIEILDEDGNSTGNFHLRPNYTYIEASWSLGPAVLALDYGSMRSFQVHKITIFI